MNAAPTDEQPLRKPLRLWPGVLAAALLCVVRFVVPLVLPGALLFGILGAFALTLVILLWWLFFSRAPWLERLGTPLLLAAGLFLTQRLVHVSIRTGGMGMLLPMSAIPVLAL